MDQPINRASLASRREWSAARIYLASSGVFLLVLAATGFAINATFPIGADEVQSAGSDHILRIFETNG